MNRFESIITSLTSVDSANILCRHEGFLYSFPVPDNLFKDRIFKYDALLDKCYRLQKQEMNLGNFCTIPVKTDLVGFLEDSAAPYQSVIKHSNVGKEGVGITSQELLPMAEAKSRFGLATDEFQVFICGGFKSGGKNAPNEGL